MAVPKIEVTTDGITGTVIKVNGAKVDGVRRFKVEQSAGDFPTIELELIATDLTLDGEMLPALPDVYKSFYEERKPDKTIYANDVNVDGNLDSKVVAKTIKKCMRKNTPAVGD